MRIFYISPIFLLFLLFLGLKLGGVIAWSWWWVTLPLWLMPVLFIAGLLAAFLVLFIFYLFSDDDDRHWYNTGN